MEHGGSYQKPGGLEPAHGVCGLWFILISQSLSDPRNLELGEEKNKRKKKRKKNLTASATKSVPTPGIIIVSGS
jgi:hypothetical protein